MTESTAKYNVIFRGEIASGQTLERVKRQLATLYQTDVAKIEHRFFSEKPFMIKTGVDYQTALKCQKSIESTGAKCDVEKYVATPKAPKVEPPKITQPVENTPSPQQKRLDTTPSKRFFLKIAIFLSSIFKLAVPRLGFKMKILVVLLMIMCGIGIEYKLHFSMEDFKALTRTDPLPHTQELVKEEKYAEAYEYLTYFMEYDYVASNPKAVALYNEIKEKRDSYLYRLGKMAEGALYGQSDELSGQVAAVATDFLVIGDIRDLVVEGSHWWQDEEVDEFVVALATIGVAATAGTLVTAGGTAVAKPVVSFLKMANKLGQVPKWLRNYLIKSAKVAKNTKKLDQVTDLFDTIYASYKASGVRSTLNVLNKADDVNSFKKLAKLNTKFGAKTAVLLDIAGDTGFKTVNKLDNVPKDVVLAASTFGKEGIHILEKVEVKRFQKFLSTVKTAARTTKVTYKHHEFILDTLVKMLQSVANFLPIGLLGLITVYGGLLLIRR